ncbi:MAG: Gfo/Idh/MocA family oxidoreductase [Bowdeniella nasicola]|nr:Gfo/Idh/MocA family oxidoreductase [Bowdeniella nasicola]
MKLPDELRELLDDYALPNPMAAPAMKWGIVGPGNIAATFAQHLRHNTAQELLAVSSRHFGRAAAFAAEYGAERSYPDYRMLCADPDVDIVYVATPHSHHIEVALAAIAAGKAVVVEKPLTATAADTDALFTAAAAAKVFVMEALWSRFLDPWRLTRELVRRGHLGEIIQVRSELSFPLLHKPRLVEPELAGGAIRDLGIYPLSFAQFLLGDGTLEYVCGSLHTTGVERDALMVSDHRGVRAVSACSMRAHAANSAEVIGTKGWVRIPTTMHAPGAMHIALEDRPAPIRVKVDARVKAPYRFEACEAARCVEQGLLESPDMTWWETKRLATIIDQARNELKAA